MELTQDQLEDLHESAAAFVQGLSSHQNPNVRLAPFAKCNVSRAGMRCPIEGLNVYTAGVDEAKALDRALPGASTRTRAACATSCCSHCSARGRRPRAWRRC
jgi:hypothetical protein